MKAPKKIQKYCPHCKTHTEHAVSIAKKRDRGSLKRGSIARAMKRGLGRGYGNKGRWGSKPTKPKMQGKKTSKKHDLRFKCAKCGKIQTPRKGKRARKIIFE